ncbi:hypothetical protein JCM14719A_22070 [Calditerricola satsumensis]|uniref:Uncharacterized protein n=1 Tax=Calditerricola satsumensis TaxID=373054 RepID=A0A8J3BER6_9BACI|nr:hypothetical protein GCM10007043_19190 [Calditerricola satsumensis]
MPTLARCAAMAAPITPEPITAAFSMRLMATPLPVLRVAPTERAAIQRPLSFIRFHGYARWGNDILNEHSFTNPLSILNITPKPKRRQL